ncbi:hypothetical protein THRCLA_00637 [Thraustotheca clavata]|uniref:Leucine-rich repeat and WD repeat-containing protein 1 n=1 Tax=Thraustotheca clavata TaxID=74557 RepID=A0A1W0AAZ3_9STRA|nr:hypothetical protein THRCLA_00637 [Thraustotheca clavata]
MRSVESIVRTKAEADGSTVDLSNAYVGNDGCAVLGRVLRDFPLKRVLDLRGNRIQADGMVHLASFLKHNTTIITLNLEWNCVGVLEHGIEALAEALAMNSTLTQLDLRNNSIGPDGATILATGLKRNRTLQELDLRWNEIGSVGGHALAEMLQVNRSLVRMHLMGNDVSMATIEVIEACLRRNVNEMAMITQEKEEVEVVPQEVEEDPKMLLTYMAENDRLQEEVAMTKKHVRLMEDEHEMNEKRVQKLHADIRLLQEDRDRFQLRELEALKTAEDYKNLYNEADARRRKDLEEHELAKHRLDQECLRLKGQALQAELSHQRVFEQLESERKQFTLEKDFLETSLAKTKASLQTAQLECERLQNIYTNECSLAEKKAQEAKDNAEAKNSLLVRRFDTTQAALEEQVRALARQLELSQREVVHEREIKEQLQANLLTLKLSHEKELGEHLSRVEKETQERFDRTVAAVEEQLEAMRTMRLSLERDVEKHAASIEKLREEKSRMRTDHEADRQSLEQLVIELRAEAQKLKDTICQKDLDRARNERKCEQLQERIQSLEQEIAHNTLANEARISELLERVETHRVKAEVALAQRHELESNLQNQIDELQSQLRKEKQLQSERFESFAARITRFVRSFMEAKSEDDNKKKLAKKSSKKAAPEGPSIAASQPPMVMDVPRMNLAGLNNAEPKVVAGNDEKAKKKSSKKKSEAPTAAPTATAIPTSAPPVSAVLPSTTAAPKDGAIDEEEKAKQAARREAKRQKQKEMEEAKKRKEEAEKQALELARREEEARQRESRKALELAALNANAEECQEEEDYDDDFENYDDERFNDEPAKGAKASKSNNNDVLDKPDEETVKKIREALQAESKSRSSTPTSSSKSTSRQEVKETKKATSSSVSSSIAGLKQAVDPRAKRIKEILDKKKFEMEKFNIFTQAPGSDMDKYMQQLRSGAVRQIFIQTNEDARGVSTQTKMSETKEQGMHFPDDRGMDMESSTGSSRHFMRFLERSAQVCEVLVEENLLRSVLAASSKEKETQASNTRKLTSIHADQIPIEELPLLQDRILVDLAFSPIVSHWLLAAYSPSNDNNAKVFPDKSILCVWDVNQPKMPISMGPNRDMFAICGTETGDIHLWDLRLPVPPNYEGKWIVLFVLLNLVAIDDTFKLRIGPPLFSTAGLKYQHKNHTSPICSVEPISSSKKGANFQVGSLDDRGVVIIWSVVGWESENNDTPVIDTCVEIGGRVKLIRTAVIDTSLSLHVGPFATLLAFFPTEPSQFVVGTTTGSLIMGSRFDKKLPVKSYTQQTSFGAVTAIAFSPFLPHYFLVGYGDGSISLFDKQLGQSIASWAEENHGVFVTSIQWSRSRSAVFFVMYSNGTISTFDLLTSHMTSILTQQVSKPKRNLSLRLSLSADIVKTCRPMLALSSGNAPNQFELYHLTKELTHKVQNELGQAQSMLLGIV